VKRNRPGLATPNGAGPQPTPDAIYDVIERLGCIQIDTLQMVQHPRRIVGDAEHLPFSENSFDSVWACAVAQYVHLDTFVSEVTRVTRPGGRALILVPNAKSPWDIIKKMFGMETWWDQKGIVKHYTVEDIRRYGRVTGEIQFLPAERYLRHLPILGHTLMLDIEVAKK